MITRLLLAALLFSAVADAQVFEKRGRLLPVGHNPGAIVARDLTDDGLPEIVTADHGVLGDPRDERPANDELSLLIAQGDLNYVKHHPSLKTDFGPYALAIANIDALRWPDIIAVNFLAARHQDVHLFLNIRQENLFKPLPFRVPDEGISYLRHRDGDGQPLFTSPGLSSVAVHDFNGDGLRDLACTGWSSDRLVIFPGNAELYFGTPVHFPAAGSPCDLALLDFDGDKQTDLAVAMQGTNEVALFRGDGKGAFEEAMRFPSRGRLPNKIRTADVNGDGLTDIVVSHRYSDDNIVIFYGDSARQYAISQEILLGEQREVLEHEIRDLVVDDLRKTGRADIVVTCYVSGEVNVFANTSGDSSKTQSFRKETYTFEGGRPRALCVADFNQDEKPDLAVTLWDVDAVGLLIQKK
jgi:hypothetical protein